MLTEDYRLTAPTLALFHEGGHYVAHTLEAGTSIKITAQALKDSEKLVKITSEGRELLMFADDLRARTERARAASKGQLGQVSG